MLAWIPLLLLFLSGMFRVLRLVSQLDHAPLSLKTSRNRNFASQCASDQHSFLMFSINKIRIYGMTYFDEDKPYSGDTARPVISAGNGRLSARSIKIFGDGILFHQIDNMP
jgi:hypothetical protein